VESSAWFWPIALFVATLTGLGKSGFGMAGGLSVPLLSLVMPPAQAAAVMLPLLLVTDAASVWAYRRSWDRENMKVLLPAGMVGIGIGWLTFSLMNDDALRIVLGCIAVGFVLNSVLRRNVATTKVSRRKGYFWGTIAGITTFIAQAGGPPILVYLLPQRLEKRLYAGTVVVFFAVMNYAKIIPYWMLGLFTAGNLTVSTAIIPFGLLGIPLGIWLQNRMSNTIFFRITTALLFLVGLHLLYLGISSQLA
jgi:uncharacterized membrane protein YfcA